MEIQALKIGVILACAACKIIGELWWHNAQRFIMPILVLAPSVSILTHVWWAGFLVLPMIAFLVEPYDLYGKSDGFDRAVWLMLIWIGEGLGPALTGHLSWFIFGPWIVLCAVWGGVTRNWWNVIIAPITGAILGALVYFVHV